MKRELLLQLLQTEDGSAVSGEKIGQALNISRAAVWKQISLLRKEGWDIRASSGGGYVLNRESDLLSQSLIASALTTERLAGRSNFCRASTPPTRTSNSTRQSFSTDMQSSPRRRRAGAGGWAAPSIPQAAAVFI